MALRSKVSRPRLARILSVHQQAEPAARTWGHPRGQRLADPAPWPALWLIGASAGLALPLVVQRLPETSVASLTQALGRINRTNSPGASSPLGIRQASPPSLLSATAPSPISRRRPAAVDPLLAVFSALPSPFDRDADLHRSPLLPADPLAAPEQRSGAAARATAGSSESVLGPTLTLADRISGSLETFQQMARGGRPIEADTTDPLPERWGEHLRALIKNTPLVLPVQVIRVRSADVQTSRTIPMALWPDGSATTNVSNPGEVGQRLAEDWVRQQPGLTEGSVRPVLMVLEPENTETDAATASAPAPADGGAQAAPSAIEPATASPAAPAAAAPSAEPVSSPAFGPAADLAGPELSAASTAAAPLP